MGGHEDGLALVAHLDQQLRSSWPDLGSNPDVGSSSRIFGASLMMAMARPSFWRMPLE